MSMLFPDLNEPVLTSENWKRLTNKPIKVIRTFRIFECFYYVIFALIVFYGIKSFDFSDMTIVEVFNATSGVSAINPRYASPLKLNDEMCTPYDLDIPKCNEEMASDSLTHCCRALFDKDSWPDQTVTSPENYIILFFISLVYFIFRIVLWRYVYTCKRGHSLVANCDIRYWILIFWDQYVTVMIMSVFAGLVTNYAKLLISSPRPVYYALQLYSSIYKSDREKLEETSQTSFISGHSASAATIMGYVTLIYVTDIQYFKKHQQGVVFWVTQLTLVPIMLATWIGLSRIMDYWHFEVDVLAGWLVGLAAVFLGYVCAAQYSRADVMHQMLFVAPSVANVDGDGDGDNDTLAGEDVLVKRTNTMDTGNNSIVERVSEL